MRGAALYETLINTTGAALYETLINTTGAALYEILINTTEEQVCNAVTELLKTNEISMNDIITSCKDGALSMIGRKRICVKINWRQMRVYYALYLKSWKFACKIYWKP